MYHKVKFVFTPTEGKAPITHNDIEDGYFYNPMSILSKHRMGKCTNAHLHIIDDGEVNVGDKIIVNNEVQTVIRFNEGVLPEYMKKFGNTLSTCYNVKTEKYVCYSESVVGKKIIASTDDEVVHSLKHMDCNGMGCDVCNAPQMAEISVDQIKYCIRLSNKGLEHAGIEVKPKTTGNHLLFKKEEMLWTDEEVIDKCKKILWDYIKGSDDLKGTDFDGGLSCEFRTHKKTNINKWADKNLF